jgi:hypothetical protein
MNKKKNQIALKKQMCQFSSTIYIDIVPSRPFLPFLDLKTLYLIKMPTVLKAVSIVRGPWSIESLVLWSYMKKVLNKPKIHCYITSVCCTLNSVRYLLHISYHNVVGQLMWLNRGSVLTVEEIATSMSLDIVSDLKLIKPWRFRQNVCVGVCVVSVTDDQLKDFTPNPLSCSLDI